MYATSVQAKPFMGAAVSVSHPQRRSLAARRGVVVPCAAAGGDDDVGAAGLAAAAAGLVANPICLWSEYTLATTGAGLQGDILGGLEGVSYLVVLGLVGWSAVTKVKTGSGLPAGPSGLLGAAEGLSYLSLLGAIGAFGWKAVNGGGL